LATRWTVAQVLAHAPDAGSARSARGLVNPRTWSDLGSNETLVWGKCQGSARAPYQVTVDLTEPAFRCTCPSRKLPCKHSIALLLMWANNNGAVADLENAEPFAADWAAERAGRKAAAARTDKAPDPEAQAKRLAERESLMSAGIDDFERWLHDIVRQGLASARRQPPSFWDTAGARLVDAQVSGLGDRVRAMGSDIHARSDWAPHLLGELGRWYLAVKAWRRRDELDEAAMGDLRTVLGWPRRRSEVEDRVTDRWWVVGLSQEENDDSLLSQRTWLYGERTGETVMLLDFAAAGQALKVAHVLGSVVDGEIARYPGGEPRRALLTDEELKITQGAGLPHAHDVAAALDQAARWLAGNPWLRRIPMALKGMTVVPSEQPQVVDETGAALTLSPDTDIWQLLALSGGHPVRLFGEWIDERLHPLTVEIDDRLVAL
jgi:hypothetical protein